MALGFRLMALRGGSNYGSWLITALKGGSSANSNRAPEQLILRVTVPFAPKFWVVPRDVKLRSPGFEKRRIRNAIDV